MAAKNILTLRCVQKLYKNTTSTMARTCSVWTTEGVVKSPYKDIEIPNCTIYDYFWQNLDKWPQKTATVDAVTGRGYTYEQAFQLSNAFAANLRNKLNIRDGDTVAVMLPNVPDYPLIVLGVLEAGGIVTTINPMYTAHEVQRQLLTSNAKAIVGLPTVVPVIREALKIAKLEIPIISIKTNGNPNPEGTILFNELSEDVHVDKSCLKKVRRSSKDVALVFYSSGTTGLPKGVELTNKNIVSNCLQIDEIPLLKSTISNNRVALMAVLPFFHIYGATVLMFHKMATGHKIVTLEKYQPEVFFNCMKKHKIQLLYTAPPIALTMASHPSSKPDHFEHLETVVNGAAPLAATDVERLFKKVQRKLDYRQGYGLTETSPVVALSHAEQTNYDSVGHALPNTKLRIVDSELNNLGPDKVGEILVHGPQVMKGYKDNPQANKETLTSDGWFRTGDLGRVSTDGLLTIVDRLKELIKVKGYQVSPAELEAVLRNHPAINDAAVIGIPHPTNGEAPKAFVILKSNHKVSEEEICNFVKEKVASYKNIHDIVFVPSIPKSSTGKILRNQLKAM